MAIALAIIRLEDFDKWKPAFDGAADVRREYGVKGTQVFRNSDNPNEVLIIYESDDLDQLWELFNNTEIQKSLKELGLQGKPKTFVLNEKEIHFKTDK